MPVRGVLLALILSLPAGGAELSPELQLCLQHFRSGERARAEKQLGAMDAVPLYRVQLKVDPLARQVTGIVQVTIPAGPKPTSVVYLRVAPDAIVPGCIHVSDASLGGKPVDFEQPEPSLFRLRLAPPMPAGEPVVLEFHLEANVPKARRGNDSLFSGGMHGGGGPSDHGAFSASPELIGLVGILPMVPPLDERGSPVPGPAGFGDLALFAPADVLAAITVPRGYAVHATGEAMGEVPEPDGGTRFSFGAAAVRDFPVLVSKDYESKTASVDDLVVESDYAARDSVVGEKVLGYAVAAVTEMQKRLGPLPYKRLRVVEAPLTESAGGMEFPGLITLSTGLYRGAEDPGASMMNSVMGLSKRLNASQLRQFVNTAGLQQTLNDLLEFAVHHEIAHQYFAGLVGSDPIREAVVDEPLAQYTAVLSMEWVHGKKVAARFSEHQLASAYQMYRLMGGQDGAADRRTDAFESSMEYAALVYGKAPFLHARQRELLGDAAFTKGLRDYVEQYRYRWSCRDCLTQVLSGENPGAAAKLQALQQRWWNEAHGDEDLGQLDFAALIRDTTGKPADQEAVKLLKQLMGQQGP